MKHKWPVAVEKLNSGQQNYVTLEAFLENETHQLKSISQKLVNVTRKTILPATCLSIKLFEVISY